MSGSLNPSVSAEFASLDQGSRVAVEYIWIGGGGNDLRGKAKMLEFSPKSVEDLPVWNYDGSSTGQAAGHNSEVLIKPERIFRDPFRGGPNIMVMCSTYKPTEDGGMTPLVIRPNVTANGGLTGNNNRVISEAVFNSPAVAEQDMWFGLEQEYTLFHTDKRTPLGWPTNGFPAPQGPYYCSVGVDNSFGRDISEAHLKACLYAGVKLSGINGEVMPGQWEYQVGPLSGLEVGDHMYMSRYIMHRVCEKFGVYASFEPKPISGDWNGAGCHTNFSTKDMRDPNLQYEFSPEDGPFKGKVVKGGFAKMVHAAEKLRPHHESHIAVYGPGNEKRLTGAHETARIDQFSYGVANRGASIRIPRESYTNGYGYLEDRRPASNMDPYIVTAKIAESILLK